MAALSALPDGMDRAPGVYVLLLALPASRAVPTGRLGAVEYATGWYAYVGSAMGGLTPRLRHHLRPVRRPHWHIDYLRPHATLAGIIVGATPERLECSIAGRLARGFPLVRGFGSSDCRCPGHLVHGVERETLEAAALEALRAAGCNPRVVTVGEG